MPRWAGNVLIGSGERDAKPELTALPLLSDNFGEPQDLCIGNHAASGPGVDGTAGPGGQLAGVGISGQTQVSVAGWRCEILHLVPAADRNRWAQDDCVAGQESKLERLRRALGAIG